MYYIGLMSGTSLDGIDVALVEIKPSNSTHLIDFACIPFEPELKSRLHELSHSTLINIETLGQTGIELAKLCAESILSVLQKNSIESSKVKAIGSHGITIRHRPEASFPFTMQITDANTLAALTSIDVVDDLRGMDMACGGQGAPLVPMFHQSLLQSDDANLQRNGIFLNLGGIANITVIQSAQPLIGYDTGPANTLLNHWCQLHLGQEFDRDGAWAASGTVLTELLDNMLQDDYFALDYPKSTGKEKFNMDWLQAHLLNLSQPYKNQDVQATLLLFTAQTVANEINRFDVTNVYLCGGGGANISLVKQLQQCLPHHSILSTADLGVDPDALEAMAFAWLAHCRVNLRAANAESVTGARKPAVLGAWYSAK